MLAYCKPGQAYINKSAYLWDAVEYREEYDEKEKQVVTKIKAVKCWEL